MIFYEKTEWGEQRGVKPFLISRLYAGVITTDEFIEKFEKAVRDDCARELEQVRGERDETARELTALRANAQEDSLLLVDAADRIAFYVDCVSGDTLEGRVSMGIVNRLRAPRQPLRRGTE